VLFIKTTNLLFEPPYRGNARTSHIVYGVKISAVDVFIWSLSTCLTERQTNVRKDRISIPMTTLELLRRAVKTKILGKTAMQSLLRFSFFIVNFIQVFYPQAKYRIAEFLHIELPCCLGLYMALSVCTKMDKVFELTSTVRVWRNVFPPVPCTARVYLDSDSTAGICNWYHSIIYSF